MENSKTPSKQSTATESTPKEGELIKSTVGRPTVYSEDLLHQLQPLLKKGYSVTKLCAEWDISRDTFYRWCQEKPEFKEEYERHEAKRDSYWEDLGWAGAAGQVAHFNGSTFQFMAGNVTKSLRPVQAQSQQTQINIENYNSVSSLSDDEINARLEALKEMVPSIPKPPEILDE